MALEGKTSVYAAVGTTSGERTLYYSAPVFAYATRTASGIGAVVAQAKVDWLDKRLSSQPGGAALLSPQGVVFAASEVKQQAGGGRGVTLMALDDGEPLAGAITCGRAGVAVSGVNRAGKPALATISGAELRAHEGSRARKGSARLARGSAGLGACLGGMLCSLTGVQGGGGLLRHGCGRGGLDCDGGHDRLRVELIWNLDDLGGALAHHVEQALHLGARIATQMKCFIGALLEVFLDTLEEAVIDESCDRAVAVDGLGLQKRVELALGEYDEAAKLIDGEADALCKIDADFLGLAHVRRSVVVHAESLRGTFESGALSA
jgi:hypothetical protein